MISYDAYKIIPDRIKAFMLLPMYVKNEEEYNEIMSMKVEVVERPIMTTHDLAKILLENEDCPFELYVNRHSYNTESHRYSHGQIKLGIDKNGNMCIGNYSDDVYYEGKITKNIK